MITDSLVIGLFGAAPLVLAAVGFTLIYYLSGFINQYYDILTLTALAIEKAGTTDANTWAPALRAVAMGPGTKCHGYLECLKLIRAGTAVDYSGVTGEMDYTDTGVVSGIYGIFKWTSLSSLESGTPLDGAAVFDLEKQSTADLAARTDEAPPPT